MSSQTTERREKSDTSAGVLDAPAEAPTKVSHPSPSIEEDRETLLKIFYQMVLIRRFEEKCAESYSLGKIGGFCHLYIGQEAVGVGAISALRPD
ncbi:MAG TPA: thiamine pyrophosphate-dependent enzyme, partial [Pyrinomonadaceae bacterium]|nr:thiamine pyrophosphate-dependent enzyme [Pyrinomonadaceae bacterium]